MNAKHLGSQGQATVEYILLISVVVVFYGIITSGINKIGLAAKITKLVTGPYAAAYQIGHPKAKSYDDGGPAYHPRAVGGENNFRILYNPESLE